MSNNNVLLIGIADARPACAGEPNLLERVRKAMRAARNFWLSADDNLRFRVALGAALMETKEPAEYDRLERSIAVIRAINAAVSGVPVDLERALDLLGGEPIPLMKLWQESE